MKKFLILLFLLVFAFSQAFAQEEQIKKENVFDKEEVVSVKTYPVSAVDPKKISKKTNGLIIYTKLYGNTTNTDTRGYEAVIINNKVIKLNQNNSYIPKKGYVVSGHGDAKKFILENLFEGADVEIDFQKGNLKVVTHPDDYLYEANYRLKKIKEIYKEADKTKVAADQMEFYINRAEKLLNTTKKLVIFHDFENAPRMAQDSMTYSDMALFFSLLYDEDEFKAIKVFPYQKTEKEVKQAFDAINNLGIDNIFIEGYYNGLTIYKSSVQEAYNLQPQNRYYNGFDPLKSWIKLARDNNKNIYVTVNAFDLGNLPKSTIKTSILSVYPEWQYKTDNGKYLLDPGKAEVQRYLMAIIDEINKKYEITGINLTGLNIPEEKVAIKEFVNKVSAYQHTDSGVKIAIDVYPYSMDTTNWNLDESVFLCPVLTSSDIEFTEDFINTVRENSYGARIYPVYTEPYNEEKPRYFFDQLTKARELGIKGFVLYNFDYLTKEYYNALRFSLLNAPNQEKEDSSLIQMNVKEEATTDKKEEKKNGTEI